MQGDAPAPKRRRQPPPKDGLNREDRRAKRGWYARTAGYAPTPELRVLHERIARGERQAKRRRAAGRWAA